MVRLVMLCWLVGLGFGGIGYADQLKWEDIGRGNRNLRAVLIDSQAPRVIYIGSKNGVLKTEDNGQTWRNILLVKGGNTAVNFLLSNPHDKNSLYAAGGSGLFYSDTQGTYWKRIFQGKNYLENEVTVLTVAAGKIYLGTKSGLFVSPDQGRSWQRQSGKLGNSQIVWLAASEKEPNCVYAACADGLFQTQSNGQTWVKIKPTALLENEQEQNEALELEQEENVSTLRCVGIDPNNLAQIYLATASCIYRSQDQGKSWEALSSYGLLSNDVKYIFVSEQSDLYAITKSGIFVYKNQRWQEISLELPAMDINAIAFDKNGNIYAASEQGLFKSSLERDNHGIQTPNISVYLKDEPNIKEVQAAAIAYAEVEPGKIKAWRKQAAKKALLPKVSVGINRDVSDLWHWEGGSTTKPDDDVLKRGKDSIEWDVTLSWDLGELIWNDDQTNIDVRSRLMVELRDNILDEVTKLYFERLRLKMELDNLTIEDKKKRAEKELRLQELAASLDALTGGYYCAHVK